jgi:hypothetical protein
MKSVWSIGGISDRKPNNSDRTPNNSDRTPNTWIKKTCPSATLSATKPQELTWD